MTTIQLLESNIDGLVIAMQDLMNKASQYEDLQASIQSCRDAIERAMSDTY
jgi:hypothetical protein